MFRNLWYPPQFYAYRNRVRFNREICFLITRTVTPLLKKRLQFNIFTPVHNNNNNNMLLGGYFNCLAARNYTHLVYSPERLALEHIRSGNIITSLVINSILKNQKVSITPLKLEALLKIKGEEFNLPITKDSKSLFDSLVGKSKYSGFAGVYVFIHIASGSMYVGSSNLLRRRMEYYFNNNTSCVDGKFLPLLNKDGFSAFKLKIYKLDIDEFKITDSLLLEQYMLLDKKYDLNTLRVVNFGPQTGNSIYVYDLSCTILYYHAPSQINLKRVLGIHQSSCSKYLDTKIPYMGSFILLSFPIDSTVPSNLTSRELLNVMNKERRALYNLGTRKRKTVVLEIKEGNILVDPSQGNSSLEFDSLKNCVLYLRSLGLTMKRDTLSKRIKEGREFYNFFCKYQEKSLPVNFDYEKLKLQLDLLMEEYKNKVVVEPKKEDNKKNKGIIVKFISDNTEKVFFSIMDTVRYYETKAIKLDRKSINRSLVKGEVYKGLTFKYKKHDSVNP